MSPDESPRTRRRTSTDAPPPHSPLSRVLVPTDFSKGAEYALRRALQLPVHKGEIVVVYVLPPSLPAKLQRRAAAEAKRALRDVVARARTAAQARRIRIHSRLLSGPAFVEIIRCSRTLRSELIVLGRHGVRPFRDLFLGTTAERVVRKGDVPVLVVGSEPRGPYQRPMIATDLGDSAPRILDLALRVVDPSVTRLTVAHSFHVPFEGFMTPALTSEDKSEYRREFRAKAAAELAALVEPYARRGVHFTTVLRAGDARGAVLAEAARRRIDLIALGTHGRSGLAHALMGSVAEAVIAAAPCDVLVARPVRFTFTPP